MSFKIAKFEKVSLEQFKKDWKDTFSINGMCRYGDKKITQIYEGIQIPKRATSGSAGYDFYAPIAILLRPGETIKIPTGIRTQMHEDWVMFCVPRSGLGFKYRLQLNNTVGVIDSDYYNSSNEGHIFAKITNDTNEDKVISIDSGVGFMQGIFLPYGLAIDDETDEVRDGGLGSTGM